MNEAARNCHHDLGWVRYLILPHLIGDIEYSDAINIEQELPKHRDPL